MNSPLRSLVVLGGAVAAALGPGACPAQGQWQSLNGGVSHAVYSFCVLPEEEYLLVGGSFPWLNTDSVRVNNMASWNGLEWSTDHTGGGNGVTYIYGDPFGPVTTLVHWNDTLYASFTASSWHEDPGIAYGAYLTDDTLWHALPARPNSLVFFLPANGHLFMGGNAFELDSLPFPGVCEVVGGQFVPLPGIPFDTHANIWACEYWHGRYYMGGRTPPGFQSHNIVSFDGMSQWYDLAQGVGGNHIRSVRGYGDSLYVGGFFNPGSNVQSRHIQIWDGEAWHPFFPGVVEFVSQVFDMKVHEGALYICGNFQFDPDGPLYGILRFDGHHLCAIGGPIPWSDNTGIAFFQNELYMGLGHDFPGLEYQWIGRLPLEGLVPDECYEVVTGVPDAASNALGITVFPNPAGGQLTVSGLGPYAGGHLYVMDMLGRMVMAPLRIASPVVQLDIDRLPSGGYMVRLDNTHGTRMQRFVKQ